MLVLPGLRLQSSSYFLRSYGGCCPGRRRQAVFQVRDPGLHVVDTSDAGVALADVLLDLRELCAEQLDRL